MYKQPTYTFFLFCILVSIGCKKKPTYNPFDPIFDVSVQHLIKNDCDTLSAGCGYYNLVEKSESSKMYYQVYTNNFNEVVAKGFVYHVDTFRINGYYKNQNLKDSIKSLPINISKLNEVIKKYNYVYLIKNKEKFSILNKEIQDTIELKINISETDKPNLFVRNLEYFRSRSF